MFRALMDLDGQGVSFAAALGARQGLFQLDGHMHYYDSTGRRRLKRRYVWGGYGFAFGVIVGLTLAAGLG